MGWVTYGSTRLILVGLATLTGSSKLILVGLATLTGSSDLHSFTLYPSLRPYGQTDRRRVKYTRFAWAGGTFFPVVLYVVSVFGSGGKKVLVYIRMYYFRVQYSCGGVLVFWLQWEIVFSVFAHT